MGLLLSPLPRSRRKLKYALEAFYHVFLLDHSQFTLAIHTQKGKDFASWHQRQSLNIWLTNEMFITNDSCLTWAQSQSSVITHFSEKSS